jgi:hypothetical protein
MTRYRAFLVDQRTDEERTLLETDDLDAAAAALRHAAYGTYDAGELSCAERGSSVLSILPTGGLAKTLAFGGDERAAWVRMDRGGAAGSPDAIEAWGRAT